MKKADNVCIALLKHLEFGAIVTISRNIHPKIAVHFQGS